jgi:raffinose/stachyose/melibiose transport system substrate-binding protein
MAGNTQEPNLYRSRFQVLGLVLTGLFYVVSVIMVHGGSGNNAAAVVPGVKTITIAHWQLEEGYREGFDKIIAEFEAMKAAKGEKVRVIQSTVPFQGCGQWAMTQLVAGKPADVFELPWPSNVRNRYFTPLSSYVAKPNPFNAGTPMAGVPWKDTFVDGMELALDGTYAEYFGVGMNYHTIRLFANMELIEKATGSRNLPTDVSEWLAICKAVEEYGKREGKPVVPIGVRGFDNVTLWILLSQYMGELNGQLNDHANLFCGPEAHIADIMAALKDGTLTRDRLLAPIEVVHQLGRFFGKGYEAVDLEQTKFLFFSGNVAFFPEGTWNAYSMIKNSPFEVEVVPIPPVGLKHPLSMYYAGRLSEMGVSVSGLFGIPKATRHPELALEFLQWMTSWKWNQVAMKEARWPPGVREAELDGVLAKFKPLEDGANMPVRLPYVIDYSWGSKTVRRMSDNLNAIIHNDVAEDKAQFWKGFLNTRAVLHESAQETLDTLPRNAMNRELMRAQFSLGLMRSDLSEAEADKLRLRQALCTEAETDSLPIQYQLNRYLQLIDEL